MAAIAQCTPPVFVKNKVKIMKYVFIFEIRTKRSQRPFVYYY